MLTQFCFFLICVQNSMLLIDVVHEIFALEDAVSFNFALGAPHVKRRVKSCRPASAAPIFSVIFAIQYVYRGRVYRGIGYIAVACWTPFFLAPKSAIFFTKSRLVYIMADISRPCISANWIYRGRMLEPIFREIASTPWTQFAGDNFCEICSPR